MSRPYSYFDIIPSEFPMMNLNQVCNEYDISLELFGYLWNQLLEFIIT